MTGPPPVSDGRASAWYVGASIAGFGATFVQTFYLALVLDATAFGQATVFLAVFGLGSVMLVVGLDGAVLRFFFDRTLFPNESTLVRHVLAIWLAAAAVLVGLALGAGWWLAGDDRPLQVGLGGVYVPAVLAAAGFAFAAIVRQLFVAQRRPHRFAMVLAGGRISVLLGIVVGSAVWGPTVPLIAKVHLVVAVALVLGLIPFVWYGGPGEWARPRFAALVRYAWPLSINTLGGAAFSSGYRIVLAAVVTLEQLGLFNIASQVSSVTYLTGAGVTRGYLPRAYQRLQETGGNRNAINFYLRVVWTTALGLGAGVLLVGWVVVRWFKGGAFADAQLLLPWLIGGQCLLILKAYAYAVATHFRRTGAVTVTSLTGAAATIGLTVPLVNAFGLTGAAVSVFIGFAVQVLWLTWMARSFADE